MIMIMKTRKIMALVLFVIISVASVPVNAFATNAPRVAVQISMSTDADKSGEVGPGDEITATVTWKGVLASAGEPVTIQVTNGAEILVHSEADVTFDANGTLAPIKSVTRTPNGETVTFTSGSPATSPLENKITFKVKAPSSAGDFNLSVKIGSNTTPNKPQNFVEEELTVNPLRLKTTLDIIDGDEPFEVFGNLAFDDAFMLAMEIHNKETGVVAFESTTMDISSDGKYSMGTFSFNDSHALGVYVVDVVLLDSNFNPIGNATKEIEHIKSVPTYHEVSYVYKDADTGKIIKSYKRQLEQGTTATLAPEIIWTNYKFAGYLLNGESVEGPVNLTITEPVEVVFLYNELFPISLLYEINGGEAGGSIITTGGYVMGTVTTVTAPDQAGCKLVGVLVNGESATLINGNQVQVTVTGKMVVKFLFERP